MVVHDEAQAGWYADPLREDGLRYWDGGRWTTALRHRPGRVRGPLIYRGAPRSWAATVVLALVLVVALIDLNAGGNMSGTQPASATTTHRWRSGHARVLRPSPRADPRSMGAAAPSAPAPTAHPRQPSLTAPANLPEPTHGTRTEPPAVDFPDPSVTKVGATYWAFATGSDGRNLSVMSSPDLVTWSDPADALPVLPSWAAAGFTWAPGVTRAAGHYLLYYTARVAATGQQCISVASSDNPAGPYFDLNSAPMVCQIDSGGSIDPYPFVAPGGARYLLWKSEANGLGAPPRIMVRELTPDGLGLTGPPRALLTATEAWQGGIVEAPTMGFVNGRYLLFYGANRWDSAGAGIGYAACDSPMGPCTNRSVGGAWMTGVAGRQGPGGPDLFADGDRGLRLAVHASPGPPGPGVVRQLWTFGLASADGTTTPR